MNPAARHSNVNSFDGLWITVAPSFPFASFKLNDTAYLKWHSFQVVPPFPQCSQVIIPVFRCPAFIHAPVVIGGQIHRSERSSLDRMDPINQIRHAATQAD